MYFEGVRRIPEIPSSNWTGKRFSNLNGDKHPSLWTVFKFMLWGKRPKPQVIEAVPANEVLSSVKRPARNDHSRVTWVGHATFYVQLDNGINFLTDPVFDQRCSPVPWLMGPKRMVDPALPISAFSTSGDMKVDVNVDFVIISHNHYDHLEKATVERLGDTVSWFVPLGLKQWMLDRGVSSKRVVELDWGEAACYRKGDDAHVVVSCLPCQHWSRRTITDFNCSLWASWAVLSSKGSNIFFGGDSGYDQKSLRLIGSKMGPFSFSLIGIGAYEPREMMCHSHVNPEEAVLTHIEIGSRFSIAMHWGTYILSREEVLQPKIDLAVALQKHNVGSDKFVTLKIGESVEVPGNTSHHSSQS